MAAFRAVEAKPVDYAPFGVRLIDKNGKTGNRHRSLIKRTSGQEMKSSSTIG